MRTLRALIFVAVISMGVELRAEPSVPGYVVETYASMPLPIYMSFDAATGALYVGRDGPGYETFHIRRIGVGGSPVENYGVNPIPDPDGVLFDAAGLISGVPGTVLVGGSVASPTPGRIYAVRPDRAVTCLFGCSTSAFYNPSDMAFDRTGRFLFTDDRSFNNTGAVMASTGGEPTVLFTIAARAKGLAIDESNRIFTVDGNGTIRIHSSAGMLINGAFVTGLASGGNVTVPLEFAPGGGPWGNDLYSINHNTDELVRIDIATGNATAIGTDFSGKCPDIKFGPDGALYVSFVEEGRIVRIALPHVWYVDAANCPGPGSGTQQDPFCKIQDAIDAAASNASPPNEIIVADGTYTGTGNKDLDFGGKIIVLRSANGPANCIIDCDGSGRGFYFHGGETAEAVVEGFTIQNGYVPDGEQGGGVFCSQSSPTLTNCTISGNAAGAYDGWGYGGGVCCFQSGPTLTNCMIVGNSAGEGFGGGVYCTELPSPTLTNCTINENAAAAGGGVDCENGSDSALTNCLISGNQGGYGGGVGCYHASPTLTNCTISGNTAAWAYGEVGRGGGMWCLGYSDPTLTNCVISGNWAVDGCGGGVYCEMGPSPTLTNCTISGNTAYRGGGMSSDAADLSLANCILWGDSPEEIELHSETVLTYCDVQGGWPGEGNINADPLFVDPDGPDNDPSTWQDNNYRLSAGSPCIDGGNNAAIPPGVLEDLDGRFRIWDGDGDGSSIVDMGAYEYGSSFPFYGDLNCDDAINGLDVSAFVLALLDPGVYPSTYPYCNILLGDMNGDEVVDLDDVEPFVALLTGG